MNKNFDEQILELDVKIEKCDEIIQEQAEKKKTYQEKKRKIINQKEESEIKELGKLVKSMGIKSAEEMKSILSNYNNKVSENESQEKSI